MSICKIDKSVDNQIDFKIDNLIEIECPKIETPIVDILWNFSNSSGKTLTNFNVVYEGGQITADWGDGSSQILTSNVNYNKTFS